MKYYFKNVDFIQNKGAKIVKIKEIIHVFAEKLHLKAQPKSIGYFFYRHNIDFYV